MSILNVNKINPVGGGSTITIAGIASVTSSVTAPSFVGAVTGNVTGNVTGTSSGLSGNPSINTTGIVTATAFVSDTPLSNRNKVINGGMLINQRSNSYTATGEEYLLDRFNHRTGSGFTFDTTTTQDSSAPDGFTKSLKITPDSTQTPSGSHNGMIGHLIEANNLLGFASGTSSAKSFALSFYAKSSSQNNNHQYSVQISKVNSGGSYYYQNRSFVVTSSWQRFTVVFPADTSNNIIVGNTEGLRILWHLSAGPDDIASDVTSWTSSNGNHAVTGQSNFMDNTSNEFYLTGVQLEVGDTVTPFEHRSFGDELALCQRYYIQYGGVNGSLGRFPMMGETPTTTTAQYVLQFPVPMRGGGNVTLTHNGTVSDYLIYTANASRTATGIVLADTLKYGFGDVFGCRVNLSRSNGDLVAGRGVQGYSSNSTGFLGFSREL